jgi:hypothetical protein
MTTPNWQHHSKKEKKRHLKPQAMRQAKARAKTLIGRLKNCHKGSPRGGSFSYDTFSSQKTHVC